MRRTVINLTAWRVATAVPTPYSEPTRLIPLMPLGAAQRIVVIISILSNLLVHNPIANPAIIKVKVIKMAVLHKLWRSTNYSLVNDVPITVPIPISKIVLVPIGHSAKSTLPLILSMLDPINAPARGATGIPVLRAKVPKIPPAIR